jgi:hypothetical protein
MNLNSPAETALSSATEAEAADPPKLSVLGVAALLVSPAGIVAMISLLWWPVAVAALVFGVLVKAYLARNRDTLRGEALATLGVAVAMVFVIASPTRFFLRRLYIADQAADIGREWLQYVIRDQPYNAFESMRPVPSRRPLSESLVWHYASDPKESKDYFDFLNNPPPKSADEPQEKPPDKSTEESPNKSLIKALMLLPKQPDHPIEVRLYKTVSMSVVGPRDVPPYGGDVIKNIFAVTWHDEQRKPHSMLVQLTIERSPEPTRVEALWRVLSYQLVEKSI